MFLLHVRDRSKAIEYNVMYIHVHVGVICDFNYNDTNKVMSLQSAVE